MANTNGNAEFKSDVFSLLLADKKRALEVYNAMNGTAYDNPELIENVTLEDKGISLSIRNDASFIINYHLSLYEHQSTYSPNMPLRELIRKKLRKSKTLEQIAEDLEEQPDKIQPLYEQIREELAASQSNKTE